MHNLPKTNKLMDTNHHPKADALLGWVLLLVIAGKLSAGPTNMPPQAVANYSGSSTSTNQFISVFDSSGRDPFFPKSTRLNLATRAGEDNSQPVVALVLSGFSGSAGRRFAIINNRTFAAGEENEVVTASGRVRIRCVEIRSNTAVITIGGGEKIELRLPSRY